MLFQSKILYFYYIDLNNEIISFKILSISAGSIRFLHFTQIVESQGNSCSKYLLLQKCYQ
ncbi:hypothetical protein B0192_20235 [Leptospira interrogans serovar Australis]|nr:hypothetical protein B0192_20235 [Leptospira interrogans serovar Australis]